MAVPIVGASGFVAGTTELLVADCVLVPRALLAVTVNVYVVPFESPVIVIGDEPPVAVNPPMFDDTVYVVIADPPLLAGALNEIVASPFPRTAVTLVGASGVVAGVTEFDALDAVLVPTEFVAVTVNVYACPFVSPVTVIGDEPPSAVNPPVFDVTVYRIIPDPPFEDGAVNETVA